MNPLHTPVQLPASHQMNHAPRLNNHYQNHGSFNNPVQNGNNQYTDGSVGSGGSYGNFNNDNSAGGGGNGGSGEHVSSGSGGNDAPPLNMGGGKNHVENYCCVYRFARPYSADSFLSL